MSTTVAELKAWFEELEKAGATHMIVVCDTFDWDDYPVPVMPHEDVFEVEAKYDGKNMQKIMEVYKISLGWEAQSGPRQVFNY
jgi:hypothetical protein